MRRVAFLLLAAAGLSGCAGGGTANTAWDLDPTPRGELRLSEGGDHGPARFWMTCRPGTGVLTLTVAARPGDPAVAELRSGKLVARYAGAGRADGETGGFLLVDFPLTASDPVLRRLADTGELTLVFNGKAKALPNGFAPAHDFLAACGAH